MGTKRVAAAAVACGLVSTAGLIAAVGGTEAQPPPGPPTGTLQLTQRGRESSFKVIADAPPRIRRERFSTGDSFLITGAVRDQAGRRAGRLQAIFVVTNARRQDSQISATFLLPGGRIVIQGADTRPRVDDFPIAGGTGIYTGARGTLRVTERRRSTEFLFTFLG